MSAPPSRALSSARSTGSSAGAICGRIPIPAGWPRSRTSTGSGSSTSSRGRGRPPKRRCPPMTRRSGGAVPSRPWPGRRRSRGAELREPDRPRGGGRHARPCLPAPGLPPRPAFRRRPRTAPGAARPRSDPVPPRGVRLGRAPDRRRPSPPRPLAALALHGRGLPRRRPRGHRPVPGIAWFGVSGRHGDSLRRRPVDHPGSGRSQRQNNNGSIGLFLGTLVYGRSGLPGRVPELHLFWRTAGAGVGRRRKVSGA